jgi:hypothetical protein
LAYIDILQLGSECVLNEAQNLTTVEAGVRTLRILIAFQEIVKKSGQPTQAWVAFKK